MEFEEYIRLFVNRANYLSNLLLHIIFDLFRNQSFFCELLINSSQTVFLHSFFLQSRETKTNASILLHAMSANSLKLKVKYSSSVVYYTNSL